MVQFALYDLDLNFVMFAPEGHNRAGLNSLLLFLTIGNKINAGTMWLIV